MFWDASALIPLILAEVQTETLKTLASGDSDFTIWWGTPVECQSAFYRRVRSRVLSNEALRHALDVLQGFWLRAYVVQPSDAVRERAGRVLALHPLRASDALQLAASLLWCEEKPLGSLFVCLDERLRKAATEEGYSVLP